MNNFNNSEKEITITQERMWIYRCQETKKCSFCPFTLSEVFHKENGQLDKESELGEHFLEAILEDMDKWKKANTWLFYCPKCNQKWAIIGKIPTIIKLAHQTSKKKLSEEVNLICFACLE